MYEIIQLLKEKPTAGVLDVTVSALRKWRGNGTGPPFIRVGRCVRYRLSDLKVFLEQNSSEKAADSPSAARKREARNAHAATQK